MSEDVEDDEIEADSVVGTSSGSVLTVNLSEQRERTDLSQSAPPSPFAPLLLIAMYDRVLIPFFASRCRSTVDTSVSSIVLARPDTREEMSLKYEASSSELVSRFSARRQRSLASRYNDRAWMPKHIRELQLMTDREVTDKVYQVW